LRLLPFLSSSLNPNDASNNLIRNMSAPVRLEIPNFSIKLSDNIAGISLNQGFRLSLHNNDGYFDNDKMWNIFNTPVYLKKSIIENPSYDDFKTIRTGFIETTTTNFDNFEIDVSDNFKSLEEPICDVIKKEDFKDISIEEDNLYKNIPIVYGTKKVKLLKLDDTHFVAAEYISTIGAIYDKNDNSISYSYNSSTNVITAANAENALITGYTNNRIGEIITSLITRKTRIIYNDTYYNMAEIITYANSSPRVNIALSSGSVKKAIQTILKSDLSFFIQHIDGRFTIRKYGAEYKTHIIPAWAITKKPEKNYSSAQENYFSSFKINYNYIDQNQFSSYLYSDNEAESENLYQKKVSKTFDTDLININDVKDLANLLSQRYSYLKQTLKISIGLDTTDFELLDTVILDTTINGRIFSDKTKYFIKEINPSQDTLVLEEI
jgi:hypothetical protein